MSKFSVTILLPAILAIGAFWPTTLEAAPRLKVEVIEDLSDKEQPLQNKSGKGKSTIDKGNFRVEITNRSFDTLKLSGKVYLLSLTPHAFARAKEPRRNIREEIEIKPFELASNRKEVIELGEFTFRYDEVARHEGLTTWVSWKGDKYEGWVVELSADDSLPQMFYSSRKIEREFDKYRKPKK